MVGRFSRRPRARRHVIGSAAHRRCHDDRLFYRRPDAMRAGSRSHRCVQPATTGPDGRPAAWRSAHRWRRHAGPILMIQSEKGTAVHGWVVLDKPKGMTSTLAVARVKSLFKAAKAG